MSHTEGGCNLQMNKKNKNKIIKKMFFNYDKNQQNKDKIGYFVFFEKAKCQPRVIASQIQISRGRIRSGKEIFGGKY